MLVATPDLLLWLVQPLAKVFPDEGPEQQGAAVIPDLLSAQNGHEDLQVAVTAKHDLPDKGLIDGVLPADPDTFQQVYRETDRLQRLVHDLQELSRVEASAYELKLEAEDIASLIAATAEHLNRQFEEKGVTLETNACADLPQVRADRDRIAQVLLNLIGNALQYTSEGGYVRITAQLIGKEIAVSVSDTGIGIAPEHLQHIFDRFYRVDRSRSRASGGSGIGLTIAKHLVEAHGGRIWAESSGPGKGSTFTFTLPRA
ncbi:MAG: sensor histidine kinase [Anaerolineae bacterium]